MYTVSKYGEVNHRLSKSLLFAVLFYVLLIFMVGFTALAGGATFPTIPFIINSGVVLTTLILRYALVRSPYQDSSANSSVLLKFVDGLMGWSISAIIVVISGEMLFTSKTEYWLFFLFLPLTYLVWWSSNQREKYQEAINLRNE